MAELTQQDNGTHRFKVTISGKEFQQATPGGLELFVVEDHIDMIAVAEATFAGSGADGLKSFKIGDTFEATVGGSNDKAFKGVITELRLHAQSGQYKVTVVAMDPLVKLAASRTTKVFTDQKDSDIATSVLGNCGASVSADATTETNKYVLQRNESDLVFCRRLAARNNYLLYYSAKDDKVHFSKTQFSGDAIEIAHDKCTMFEVALTTTQIPKSVDVHGWDYVQKQKVTGTATDSSAPIGGGSSTVGGATAIWQDKSHVSDVWVASESAANAMAAMDLDRAARTGVRGRATIQGNGEVRAGVKVKFTGQADGFNAEGFVVSSRHSQDSRGFITELHFVGNTWPT